MWYIGTGFISGASVFTAGFDLKVLQELRTLLSSPVANI
jgi:hypothetical protein